MAPFVFINTRFSGMSRGGSRVFSLPPLEAGPKKLISRGPDLSLFSRAISISRLIRNDAVLCSLRARCVKPAARSLDVRRAAFGDGLGSRGAVAASSHRGQRGGAGGTLFGSGGGWRPFRNQRVGDQRWKLRPAVRGLSDRKTGF